MSIRPIIFAEDEFFHIYNRGTNKMQIFNEFKDYDRFMKLLYVCNSDKTLKFSDVETSPGKAWTIDRGESLVDIGAYVLMPNHYHMLLKPKSPEKLSKFLLRLQTSYSMFFNKKNNRTGSLFGSKFKAEHANTDKYLKYLFSYIHLNPVKLIQSDWKEKGIQDFKKAKQHLEGYQFSSYLDHKNIQRPQNNILNVSAFPKYFMDAEDFNKEVRDWLNYEKI